MALSEASGVKGIPPGLRPAPQALPRPPAGAAASGQIRIAQPARLPLYGPQEVDLIGAEKPSPIPDKNRVEEHFSREAEAYSQASASGLWKWWRRREVNAIMRQLRPREGELILDAGSGAGFYSEQLLARGARVIACDLSAPMVREAHRRLAIGAFVCDLQAALPLRARFDAVLCAGALEFCPSPEDAIVALAGALGESRAARVVLMLPAENMAGRLYRRFHSGHGFAIQLFSRERLKKMAELAGLRLEAVRPIGFNYVVLLQPRSQS